MRHGRAKAARKTLRHFERTVNLKSKPYYSVLLDATFLIAMIRITSNNTNGNDNGGAPTSDSTIISRIERVLQVNNGSFSGNTRDARLSGVVGDNYNQSWNDDSQQKTSNHGSDNGHRFNRYNVRYFIPEEAVDEIETIIETFKDRCEKTKKRKKQMEYEAKSKVFEDALSWIKSNSSRKHSHRGSGRCEVLPRLQAVVELPSKKKKHQQQPDETEKDEANDEPATIGASDAVKRHIARDDGREDSETNQTINKKQQQELSSFTRTYIVASQEEDLLDDLRVLGTVPILRCANHDSVLILENPSKKGQRTDNAKEQNKWRGALQNPAEKALVDAAWDAQKKNKIKITGISKSDERGRNNRAKGPNPLSCKRRRTDQRKEGSSGESKSKKRRARAQRSKVEESSTTAASPKE